MKPIFKGQFEYIKLKKRQRAIVCAVCFLLVIAVFLTGYFSTGTRENILTVMAILGVLPAAKFAATLCMMLPYHSQTEEAYLETAKAAGEGILYADMLLSTEKKILSTDFIVIRGGNVCGLATHPKYDVAFAQEYVTGMLKRNGVKANVKIFTDKNKFLRRVKELAALEVEEKQEVRDERTAELILTLVL